MRRLLGLGAVAVLVLVGVFLGSALSQYRADPSAGAAGGPERPRGPSDRRIRVEVLNGGGVAGLAGSATDRLRDSGFDVVYFGNAPSFDHDTSFVLDRVGRLDGARAVADALGIRTVRSEPDANLYLDVTVVLGTDWRPDPNPSGSPDPNAPAWWDPRRWLGR